MSLASDRSSRTPLPSDGAHVGRTGVARRRLLLLATLALAVFIAFFAAQGLAGSTVYYLTPTEARDRRVTVGTAVRLGGLVEPGSLQFQEQSLDLRFTITDGTVRTRVIGKGAPPGLLREGAGAVVEGSFAADGTFNATQVIAKHDEVYAAPPAGATPPHKNP